MNLSGKYLRQLIEKQSPVYIFLKNGIKLQGFIVGFDEDVIAVSDKPAKNFMISLVVYQHAIATFNEVDMPVWQENMQKIRKTEGAGAGLNMLIDVKGK